MTVRWRDAIYLAATLAASVLLCTSASANANVTGIAKATSRLLPQNPNLSLRLPKEEKIAYQGVVSFDQAGTGSAGILYPAVGGLVGVFAAVLTHAAVVEGAKSSQKSKLQEEADKILEPYQSVLSEFPAKDLLHRALDKVSTGGTKRLVGSLEEPGATWLVETAPVFSLTQDQSALVLDNLISIYRPDAPTVVAYQKAVRVVLTPKDESDPVGYWTARQGENLKDESASLFAHSLEVAIAEAKAGPPASAPSQKTFRYAEGKTERIERAYLVSERCDRIVIKTLRGGLMSVPTRRTSASASDACVDAASVPKPSAIKERESLAVPTTPPPAQN